MKYLINISLALYLILISASYPYKQPSLLEIDYKFEIRTPSGSSATLFYNLIDDGKASIYSKKDSSEHSFKTLIQNGKRGTPPIYYNKVEDVLFQYYPIFNKDYFIKENKLSENFRWYVDDQVRKEILGFECKFAQCEFRGRKYNVYFAPDLLFYSGPWKLTGLPGTILQAETEDGMFKFLAYSLQVNGDKKAIENPYLKLKADYLSFRDHKSLLLKKINDLQKKAQADEPDEDVDYKFEDYSIEKLSQ